MKNRAILSRMGANKKPYKKEKKAVVIPPIVDGTGAPPPIIEATGPPPPIVVKQILMKYKNGEVVYPFNTMDEAVEKGFKAVEILKAIENKTKYKRHYWEYSE